MLSIGHFGIYSLQAMLGGGGGGGRGGLLESCTYWRAVAINKVITVCTQSKQQLAGDSLLLVCIIYVLFYMYNFSGDFDK